jgi:hypothetical protein
MTSNKYYYICHEKYFHNIFTVHVKNINIFIYIFGQTLVTLIHNALRVAFISR